MKLLIVGCGYVGSSVVRKAAGYERIYALTRTEERAEELAELGVEPIVGNWLNLGATILPEVEHVLVSVPHRPDPELGEQTHVEGLLSLTRLIGSFKRLIYLSTTGVYGQAQGVVNEATPASPTRIGPEIAVAAERWLQAKVDASRLTILRLAGIYGPGRIPLAARLKAGESLQVPQQGHLNLVHVVDIARVVHAAFQADLTQTLYLLSDGNPVQRNEFYGFLAKLCGVAEPKYEEPDPNSPKVRRATDKQVSSAALVQELHYEFEYPDYRAGLRQSLGLVE